MSGHIERIWIKRMKAGPMDPAEAATLSADRGIVGNADQGGRRQVTIIEREAWDEMMADLGGPTIDPSARRANILVRGVSLRDSRGKVIRVGGCRIRIEGETRPCEQMDAAYQGLRRAMASPWRGGAYGVVLDDGEIRVGDPVAMEADLAGD
jgi:MOSC domain-containing protein YiiM